MTVGALSSGERQRVVLARLLIQRGAVLLLDEPNENLDAEGRRLLRGLLEELKPTRMIALVTHDPELLSLADMVVDLDDVPNLVPQGLAAVTTVRGKRE